MATQPKGALKPDLQLLNCPLHTELRLSKSIGCAARDGLRGFTCPLHPQERNRAGWVENRLAKDLLFPSASPNGLWLGQVGSLTCTVHGRYCNRKRKEIP